MKTWGDEAGPTASRGRLAVVMTGRCPDPPQTRGQLKRPKWPSVILLRLLDELGGSHDEIEALVRRAR